MHALNFNPVWHVYSQSLRVWIPRYFGKISFYAEQSEERFVIKEQGHTTSYNWDVQDLFLDTYGSWWIQKLLRDSKLTKKVD